MEMYDVFETVVKIVMNKLYVYIYTNKESLLNTRKINIAAMFVIGNLNSSSSNYFIVKHN